MAERTNRYVFSSKYDDQDDQTWLKFVHSVNSSLELQAALSISSIYSALSLDCQGLVVPGCPGIASAGTAAKCRKHRSPASAMICAADHVQTHQAVPTRSQLESARGSKTSAGIWMHMFKANPGTETHGTHKRPSPRSALFQN